MIQLNHYKSSEPMSIEFFRYYGILFKLDEDLAIGSNKKKFNYSI